jgi:DNA mismatch repair protein MutL
MPAKLHPVYFLEISMPPEWVDVNVHPTKTEVRFLDGARVFTALLKVTSEALAGGASFTAAMAPSSGALPFGRSDSFDRHRYGRSDVGSGTVSDACAGIERAGFGLASWTGAPAGRAEPPPSGVSAQLIKGPGTLLPEKILQVHETYAVFETPEGLALVDQHALHERVLYESLRAEFEGGGIRLQRLLLPITIDLEPGLAARAESICAAMNRLGIDAEPFGREALRVSAVPAILKNADPRSMVIDVIDRLARDEEGDEAYRGILFRMACRAAVKAGHRLSAEELKALMKSAEGIDFTGHCPHGRPTTVSFSLADIERLFKRRGF